MRNSNFARWDARSGLPAGITSSRSRVNFRRVSYRQFTMIPEGFMTVDSLCFDESVRPDPIALKTARVELAKIRSVGGLAALRLEKGLSQVALADKIGTSQPRLSIWEKGEEQPGLGSFRKLAIALDVSYERLMDALNG